MLDVGSVSKTPGGAWQMALHLLLQLPEVQLRKGGRSFRKHQFLFLFVVLMFFRDILVVNIDCVCVFGHIIQVV